MPCSEAHNRWVGFGETASFPQSVFQPTLFAAWLRICLVSKLTPSTNQTHTQATLGALGTET